MIPNNATSATAAVSSQVLNEIVSLPLYIFKTYGTQLAGMGVLLILGFAILGIGIYLSKIL